MKIFYLKDSHVIIKFGATELAQALGVLKALAQYFKADFIFKVAQELQDDLFPKPKLQTACCTSLPNPVFVGRDVHFI